MTVPPDAPLPPPTAPGGASRPLPPPPSPAAGGWAPPPYAPPAGPRPGPERGRRRGLVVGGIVAAVALVALVVGLVAANGGDDEQTADTTDAPVTTARPGTTEAPATTRPEGSTTTGAGTATTRAVPATTGTGAGTTTGAGAGTTYPPAIAPASAVTPPPITSVSQGILPADAAALRATLDAFAFPAWWPLPDHFAGPMDAYPTVQAISADDSLVWSDVKPQGYTSWSTSWLDPNPDLAAAEATWTARLPNDLFDIASGVAAKTTTIQQGKTINTYYFEARDGSYQSVSLRLQEAITDAGEKVGVFVDVDYQSDFTDNPAAVPVGPGPGKSFLPLAPTSGQMRWLSTSFDVRGGSGIVATSPYGSYEATWTIRPDQMDTVITYLADPTHFTGDLRPVAPGSFVSDDTWSQDMVYGPLAGEYQIYKSGPSTSGDIYVTLEFDLPEG